MRNPSLMALPLLLLVLGGCTNLKVVRDYAGESAKLSAYTELTDRYRDTYQREQPYLDLANDQGEKATDEKRQAAYESLIKIHQSLTAYMETLAKLAGEDAYSLSKNADALAGAIKPMPDLGISADQVDAYSSLVQVVARWATAACQESAVRKAVEAADPHVQKLLAAMQHLVRLYRKTNEQERARVVGVFEVAIPYTNDPKDVLLNRLARVQMQSRIEDYKQADLKYAKAEKALAAVAEGHRKLREGLANLSREDLKQSLTQTAKDIKTIRESLNKVSA
jgi:hypothetical protein